MTRIFRTSVTTTFFLRVFLAVLLIFAIGIIGCSEDSGDIITETGSNGHEPIISKGPPPKVVSINISEGQKISNADVLIIVAVFSKDMEDATITVSNAGGLRFCSKREATWMSMEEVAVGSHTITISGRDTFRQELEEFEPITFFIVDHDDVEN